MTHLGVVLPAGGDPDVARAARAIEEAGLDGVWSGDHLATGQPYLHSTAMLAAAAAVTERVSVGWSVLLPALRPPGWAAKEIASVQAISGGRLELGVGLGPPGPEWRMAGTTAVGRTARTDAFLAALPDLLAGHRVEAFTDGPIELDPPVPMPPLWIGGGSDAALARAARCGAGWIAAMLAPSDLARRVEVLADLAGAPPRVATMVFAAPAETAAGAPTTALVERLGARYGLDAATADRVIAGGPPAALAERFAQFRDAGAGTLIVVPSGPDLLAGYEMIAAARALM